MGVRVSVICPTYNQAKYLRQGLDSILEQDCDFEIEILIGEDKSPDNTNEILAEYEAKNSNIFVYHREHNLKQARNIYDLFMKAKGDYVITLDLDDYWTDNHKLSKQVSFLDSNPEYIGVAHDYDLVDANNNPIHRDGREIKKFLNCKFTLEDFLEDGFVFQTGTFMYRNIWKTGEDWTILYKADETVVDLTINSILLRKANIFIMRDCMSVYREVIDDDALNFRSICNLDKGTDWYKMAIQYQILNDYFGGELDYSKVWADIISSYFKAMLLRVEGTYKVRRFLQMYYNASTKTKKKVKKEITQSIKRKLYF